MAQVRLLISKAVYAGKPRVEYTVGEWQPRYAYLPATQKNVLIFVPRKMPRDLSCFVFSVFFFNTRLVYDLCHEEQEHEEEVEEVVGKKCKCYAFNRDENNSSKSNRILGRIQNEMLTLICYTIIGMFSWKNVVHLHACVGATHVNLQKLGK